MGTSEDACTLVDHMYLTVPLQNTINEYGLCLKCKELLSNNLKADLTIDSATLMARLVPIMPA